MLLVASYWVPCDGLASHRGGEGGGVALLLVVWGRLWPEWAVQTTQPLKRLFIK